MLSVNFARRQRPLPALGVVEVADRVDVAEDQRLDLAGLEGGADLVGGAARLGRREAGPEVLGAADLAEPAGVRGAGNLVEAAALHAVEAEDVGEAEQRLGDLLAVVAGEHPLAPDDHDRAGVAQRVREAGGVGFVVAGADRGAKALDEAAGRAGRVALGLEAAARVDRGAAVEGGRALGRDEQLGAVAADRLADPQLDDRHLVHRVAAEDEDRAGVVDVGGGDGELRGGEPGAGGAAETRSGGRGDVGGAERRRGRAAGSASPPRSRCRRRRSPRSGRSPGPGRAPPSRAPRSQLAGSRPPPERSCGVSGRSGLENIW